MPLTDEQLLAIDEALKRGNVANAKRLETLRKSQPSKRMVAAGRTNTIFGEKTLVITTGLPNQS